MQTHLISKDFDDLLSLDVIIEDFREQSKLISILIASLINLYSHLLSYSTVDSFKHLRREEKASFGQSQPTASKREESIQRKIGKWFFNFFESLKSQKFRIIIWNF